MSGHDYDLFVIGGGSGGVRAARVAAATGARVALAEEDRMGGTCVIRGCVPKKLMVFASEYRHVIDDAQAYGWSHRPGDFHWPTFRGRLHAELDRLEEVYRKLLSGSGVTTYDARATLTGPNSLALSTGETVTADKILIATGGRPAVPEMPNAHLGITSNEVFTFETLPRSILIIGGGYIACEMACILSGLGVETTLYYRGAGVLRGFDDEARGLVSEAMREQGIDLHVGTTIVQMAPADAPVDTVPVSAMGPDAAASADLVAEVRRGTTGPIRVKASNGMEKVFDQVLFATGRTPNTEGLGLGAAGVATGRRGEVVVDAYSRTAVPNIYAIGDVTGRVELTPVAIREAMAFVRTAFQDDPTPVDHALIPSAVFTQPELGTVGLTEEAAAEQEPIEVYCTSFRPMQTAFAGRPNRVLMKLVVSKATRKVLGCHIVAPHAAEMIQLAGIAVKMGATKEDFDRTVAVHPTMSEELVTMREPMRTA